MAFIAWVDPTAFNDINTHRYNNDNQPPPPPPPPYDYHDTPKVQAPPAQDAYRPGFWTGAAVGSAGTMLANNVINRGSTTAREEVQPVARNRLERDYARGEGSSSSSSTMRTSTGYASFTLLS